MVAGMGLVGAAARQLPCCLHDAGALCCTGPRQQPRAALAASHQCTTAGTVTHAEECDHSRSGACRAASSTAWAAIMRHISITEYVRIPVTFFSEFEAGTHFDESSTQWVLFFVKASFAQHDRDTTACYFGLMFKLVIYSRSGCVWICEKGSNRAQPSACVRHDS